MTGYLHRDEVEPIPKPTRPWNCGKGNPECSRTKPCRSCLNRRNRESGRRKQRQSQKVAGIPMTRFAGRNGNEESWEDPRFRWECKSGAQVGPIWTRYLAAEKQSYQNKAIGDARPFAFIAMPKGVSEGLVIMRASTFRRVFGGPE